MKTKTVADAAAAAKQRRYFASNGERSFTSGLLLGLSAASLIVADELPRPRASHRSVDQSWNAVGSYLRGAMRDYGGER